MNDSPHASPHSKTLRQGIAHGWLSLYFWLCEHTPRLLDACGPLICRIVFRCSPSIRHGTAANARRLLGPNSNRSEQARLARQTLASFYQFCCDVGKSRRSSIAELLGRIESVSGRESYQKARAAHRGLIVITAHMGSFEVAMATLRSMEPRVHVLFQRDAVGGFERQRARLRQRLGVTEIALEEGVGVWIKLRNALLADEVVVIQGDRVLPGQKGQLIQFGDARMEMPASPIMLAMASGAPILPIFSVRTHADKIRLLIEEPIEVAPESSSARGEVHPAMLELARVIQRRILAHPSQWHVLDPAWRDDQPAAKPVA